MNIKERFPDEDALRRYFDGSMSEHFSIIKDGVGHLEKEHKMAMSSASVAFFVMIFSFVIFTLVIENYSLKTPSLLVAVAIFIYIAVVFSRKLVKSFNIIKRFNIEFDRLVFEEILNIFDLGGKIEVETGSFFQFRGPRLETADKNFSTASSTLKVALEGSELITEPHNRIQTDDAMLSLLNDKLDVWELKVQNATGSGKNKRLKEIFEGYFLSYKLPKKLEGKTFVSTEGDRSGFGHQTFWSNLFGDGVETTELEWNDFENKLHVSSTDLSEVRYILTTDFMEDLYNWWEDKNENIRLSFIEDKMFLLFPDKRINFAGTILSLKEKNVRNYLESIALPLLHVLHLIEDVENRFRS